MAFYPRKRALKQTPSMRAHGNDAKALNFLCYKVGMVQVMGKNIHHGNSTFGQEVVIPATIIVCPPMKVFGIRAYAKAEIGVEVLGDALAENIDKILLRKILNFKKPKKKEGKEAAEKGGKEKESKEKEKKKGKEAPCTISDFEKELNSIEYFTLLAHTTPDRVEIKKTPDICEISIGGKKEEQLAYAKEKLGREINIEEIAKDNDFLDVKAVTTGKGFQGVVKRFHVRMQRPKAKTRRVVGSIGPWHPHTVMFTVARAGQMGYQSRTEYNKRVLKISDKPEEINPKSGFINYGSIIGKYAIIQGTLPGPTKRCIAIRKSTRPERKKGIKLETVGKVIVN
jgi:large subunit ribosomal protein L3